MSNQQLSLQLEKAGGLLVLRSKDIPSAPAGELVIKIHATALNPVDWKIQSMPQFLQEWPAVLGTDIAGEVEAVGEGVTKFKKGDRVLTQGAFAPARASFQQYTILQEDLVAKLPESVSYEEAATIPLGFITAAIGLLAPWTAALNPEVVVPPPQYTGQTILVIGGSTSVGQYVIQLAKHLGFTNIITYASKKHHAYLTELGATQTLDRAAVPLSALGDAISGTIDVVYELVASTESQDAATQVVRAGGKVVSVNMRDVRSDAVKEAGAGKHFYPVAGSSHMPGQEVFGAKVWAKVEKLISEGVIKPNRYELLPGGLNAIIPGLERMRKDEVSGVKLVVRPQETEQ
ncbi:GroES-like protein [Cylindrobasidium torrendii FP15055 ss-10]|uniref:GroES-like protein n=1 Tax=Cylindrobasidium torrendii FP15055 ss-10 TaxID=1314674 RepID=A0A0D7BIE6_9AGAR|nr:GroES-like protein [Cylindrobasidium torrendii FP15055 ss-10]